MASRSSLRRGLPPRERRHASRVAVRNAPKSSRHLGRWRSVSPSSASSSSSSPPPTDFQTPTRERRSVDAAWDRSRERSSNDDDDDSGLEILPPSDDTTPNHTAGRLTSPADGDRHASEAAAIVVAMKKTAIARADGECRRKSTVTLAPARVDAKSNRMNERDAERSLSPVPTAPRAARLSSQTKSGAGANKRGGGRAGRVSDPRARATPKMLPPLPPAAVPRVKSSLFEPSSNGGDRVARPPLVSQPPRDVGPNRSGTTCTVATTTTTTAVAVVKPPNPIAAFKEKIQKRAAAVAAASTADGIVEPRVRTTPTTTTTAAATASTARATVVATRDYASDYRRLLRDMERELQLDVRRLLRAWIAAMIVFENELPTFYRGVSLADLAVLATLLDNAFAVTFDRSDGDGGGGGGGVVVRNGGSDRAQPPAVSKIPQRSETVRHKEGGDGAVVADDGGEWTGGDSREEDGSERDLDDDDDDDGCELGSYLDDYELAQNLSWLGANEIFVVCLLATKNVVDIDETVMLPSNASAFSPHIAAVLANFYQGFARRPSRDEVRSEGVCDDSGDGSGGTNRRESLERRERRDDDGDDAGGDAERRRDDGDANLVAVFAGQRGFMMRALTSMHLHALDYTKPFVFADQALASAPPVAPEFDCADAKLVDAIARKLGRAVRRSDYAHVSDHDQLLLPRSSPPPRPPSTARRTVRRDVISVGPARFQDSDDVQRGTAHDER